MAETYTYDVPSPRALLDMFLPSKSHKFTGKERDIESGLDDFVARHYASSLGRFMQPDPLFATPLHVVNPQRWNMYAYVVNNPTNYIDPDGKDAIAVNFVNEVPLGGHEAGAQSGVMQPITWIKLK